MKRRVVITGIGPVTAMGIGKNSFFKNILDHQTKIYPVPREYERHYKFKSRYFVPVPKLSLDDYGLPPSLENAMEKIAKLSVVGAKIALEDAGIHLTPGEKYFQSDFDFSKRCDVIIGVGMSSLETALESHLAHLFGRDHSFLKEQEIKAGFHRMVIPMLMPNSAAAWISILYGFQGTNFTVNASCASGTYAIGEAYRRILHGYCDRAITGGVECLEEKNGAIMRGFDMLSTLTGSTDGNPMPFSKNRSGFLFNEGAGCILVLEELEAAKRRGAVIYAEILDFRANSDAFNIVQMDGTGKQITDLITGLIRELVQERKIKIDYFNAHGTGTAANDEIEARMIRQVFGDQRTQPLINSTKGILGHSIGASGALEAAVTALSLYYGQVHGNKIDAPMDNLNLVPASTEVEINYAISASYGFGGHNGAILLKRYDA